MGTGVKPKLSAGHALPWFVGQHCVLSTSAGATRKAPATEPGASLGAAWAMAMTPRLWATSTAGRDASLTAATMLATHAWRSGACQSS